MNKEEPEISKIESSLLLTQELLSFSLHANQDIRYRTDLQHLELASQQSRQLWRLWRDRGCSWAVILSIMGKESWMKEPCKYMSFAFAVRQQHTDMIDPMTANSKTQFSSVSNIIGALQNILTCSQVIIPDLATEYPNSNMNYSEFNYQSISAIIAECQQHLDTVSHKISRLEAVMDSIKHIHQQLVAKKKIITQSMNLHK
ncbi:hypothetical protein EDB19DRAFT_1831602 [Suillus lakei]|nr:hypothetical protein EDB19DRAFT_1831602 [Suillus lakei]